MTYHMKYAVQSLLLDIYIYYVFDFAMFCALYYILPHYHCGQTFPVRVSSVDFSVS